MFVLDDEEEDEDAKVALVKEGRALEDKIDHMLIESRRIFFSEAFDAKSARDAIRKLWYLELKEPGKPILLVINSPGGSVDAGFAIWDQVKMLQSPVATLVTGLAASMGSVLSLCAEKGMRFATPNSRIMMHQPSIHGVIRGQATDLEIQAEEITQTRKAIIDVYVASTGKSAAEIEKHLSRDCWFKADEAVQFGLLDEIVSSYAELDKKLATMKPRKK